MTKDTVKMTRTTIIMPDSLWRRFKIQVILEGTSLQAKIRELVRQYLDSKAA